MKLKHKESKGMFAAIRDVTVGRFGSVEAYARSRGVGADGLRQIRSLEKNTSKEK